MPNDGSPAVPKLPLAVTGVVVAKQEVVIKGGEAVPAEDMLAPFAHHLSTPGVPLDGHTAHGAPLDVVVAVVRKEERVHWLPSTFHQGSPMLCTREPRVPCGGAEAAKLFVACWAGHGHAL